MMLEQIERNQQRLQDQVDKIETKTIGVAVPIRLHTRLRALVDKSNPKRANLKVLALGAIEAGLDLLEHQYKEAS